MTTRPSLKMLASLVGGGMALAVALGAAAMLPRASNPLIPAVLLGLGAVVAVVALWFAISAQLRRERSTLQKSMNGNFGKIASQTADVEKSVAGLHEELGAARGDLAAEVKSASEGSRGLIADSLELLRAQDVAIKGLDGIARRNQRLAEVGDVRAELRAGIDKLTEIRSDIAKLGGHVAAAEKNSSDSTLAVRRVQNYLRKEGNIQIVLDRLIASERRTLGALETTRWEFGDELARAADAHEEIREDARRQLGAVREVIAESDRARGAEFVSKLDWAHEAIADQLSQLENVGNEWARAVDGRLDGIDSAASARDHVRGEDFAAKLEELRGNVIDRLGSLEGSSSESNRTMIAHLEDIASVGHQAAEHGAGLSGGIEAARTSIEQFEIVQGDAARRSESVLEQVQALRAELEASAVHRTGSADGERSEDGTAVALKEAVEEIKAYIASTGKANETDLRRFVLQMNDRTHRQFKRETIEGVRQTEALLQLIPRVDTVERQFPATGWWALTADTVLYLSDYLLRERPKRILEIGSGASTIWLGTFAQRIGAEYVSIEHDESFAAHTRTMIAEHGLEGTVDLRHAPLAPLEIDGEEFSWYDRDAFEDIGDQFDLLVVDGPPESTGEMARYPAMPVLAERLADDAAVVLDDIHREAETESLRRWAESYPGFEIVQAGLSRTGIMVRRSRP